MTALPVQGVLQANDGQVIRAAAIKHLGILLQQMTIIHDGVVAGRLVPILQAYPTRRHLPAKVRCFVDFLVEKFAELHYNESRWTA